MVDAVPELVKPASVALFAHQGVFTEKELRARADVSYELYAKTVNIEALTMIDMAGKDISMRTAQYDLQILVRLGLVRREGRGPAQRYIVLPAARGFRA